MATIDGLSLPFATWQEGLLAFADALGEANREKIMVARLEATTERIDVGPKEICALALLVPCAARFGPGFTYEPHPEAVRFAAMVGDRLSETMTGILDGIDRRKRLQEEKVFSAFPESDTRRLLVDTIFGFASAELSDVTQRLGESDPFSRLAARLSLWFKQSRDLSRYGLPYAHEGRSVIGLVRRLAQKLESDATKKIRRLLDIWTGDVVVERSDEHIRDVASLISVFEGPDIDHLDFVLVMEIFGSLAEDIEGLDIDSLDAFSKVLPNLAKGLDDGRPITADIRNWLKGPTGHDQFRLIYDPSQAFWSAMHADDADVLEPLLVVTLEQMSQGGHAVFPTGPLPIHGSIFNRDRKMAKRLGKDAPEAADLFRLVGDDGDYNDMDGPYPPQCFWVGDFNPDAITFPDAIKNAAERRDHALCDMLIGCWLLFCTAYKRAPLPDLVGLARCITGLPVDHRSSTYAVLAMLKREAVIDARLRRDVNAILSWLPLVDMAPPDDPEANMRDQFTRQLWDTLGKEEKESLCKAEMLFVRARRLSQLERYKEPIDAIILGWSRVAEPSLRRVLVSLGEETGNGKPLGQLIGLTKKVLKRSENQRSLEERHRLRLMPAILDVLDQLDLINKKGVKHLDGVELTWEQVVIVHSSIHWTLKTLLDAAHIPLTITSAR